MHEQTLSSELIQALISISLDSFTAMELRDAYLEHSGRKGENCKKVRQLIYRSISKLEQQRLIEKIEPNDKGKAQYRITSKLKPLNNINIIDGTPSDLEPDDIARNLRDRLHHYRVEMLTAMGETEEYDAICQELPQIRGEIQTLYDQARDRCTKTLGRVRALEIVLSNHLNQ